MELKASEVEESFQLFSEHKGYLDADDLYVALCALFPSPPFKFEVRSIAEHAGGRVSLEEFRAIVAQMQETVSPKTWLRAAFRQFDVSRMGSISVDDVARKASEVGVRGACLDSIKAAFSEADLDMDGKVTLQDFEYVAFASRVAPTPASAT